MNTDLRTSATEMLADLTPPYPIDGALARMERIMRNGFLLAQNGFLQVWPRYNDSLEEASWVIDLNRATKLYRGYADIHSVIVPRNLGELRALLQRLNISFKEPS